mgnify:CR=1 FL=1
MNRFLLKCRSLFELQAFGVCTYIGEKMGIPIRYIRLFFVYLSFLTYGSPLLVYLCMIFLLNIKQYIKNSKKAYSRL